MATNKPKAKPVKTVANAILYDDGTILIQGVRGSYVHADKPWAKNPEKETPRYSITGMLPKTTHVEAKDLINNEIKRLMATKEWELAADKKFLRNGDTSGKAEYKGHWIVATGETNPPLVYDANGKDKIPQAEIAAKCKSGYWYDILVRPWIQSNVHGKRINAGISMIQYRKKDEVFGQDTIDEEDARSRTTDYSGGDDGGSASGYDEDDLDGL